MRFEYLALNTAGISQKCAKRCNYRAIRKGENSLIVITSAVEKAISFVESIVSDSPINEL